MNNTKRKEVINLCEQVQIDLCRKHYQEQEVLSVSSNSNSSRYHSSRFASGGVNIRVLFENNKISEEVVLENNKDA